MRFVATPSLLTLSLTDHKKEIKLAASATRWEKSPAVTRAGVCWQQQKAISPVIVLVDCVIFILFKGITFPDGRRLSAAYGLLPTCFIGFLAALKLQQLQEFRAMVRNGNSMLMSLFEMFCTHITAITTSRLSFSSKTRKNGRITISYIALPKLHSLW